MDQQKEYEELDLKELEDKFRAFLRRFVTETLPKIEAAFAPLLP